MMNKKFKPLSAFLLTIAIFTFIQACAGTGNLGARDVRVYRQNIDKMLDITRQAIRNSRLEVMSIDQNTDASRRTVVVFVRRGVAGNQQVNNIQGHVYLSKVDTADAVKVRVENPDYTYATPSELRQDYAKILFEEIDRLLE